MPAQYNNVRAMSTTCSLSLHVTVTDQRTHLALLGTAFAIIEATLHYDAFGGFVMLSQIKDVVRATNDRLPLSIHGCKREALVQL